MNFTKLPPPAKLWTSQPTTRASQLNKSVKPKRGYKYQINKSLLPTPTAFYQRFSLELKGIGVWKTAKCPFHDDKHASLSINIGHGGYCCHACGAKGDMLNFYKEFHQVDFKTACHDLGLFEEVRQ